MSTRPSWLESTMEVIGSTKVAVNQTSDTSRASVRSASPLPRNPGTPKRPASPGGDRLPSNDVLNRSIHNDSNHGNKPKDQIIVELKKANAALTSKLAEVEADFMNQCSSISSELKQNESLLYQKEDQLLTLQARLASTEKRIRERDQQNSQLKEELSFARHNVTDLKNQVYQLQHEVEDAEYDKVDEMDKLEDALDDAEKQIDSMKRDNDDLHHELEITIKDKDEMKKVITKLEDERNNMRNIIHNLEDEKNDMKKVIHSLEDERDDMGNIINDLQNQLVSCRDAPCNEKQNEKTPTKMTISCGTDIDGKNEIAESHPITALRPPSPANLSLNDSIDSKEIMQNWKQLDETQKKLSSTQKLLYETQSNLATLEHKYKATITAHEEELSNAKKIARSEWKTEWALEMEKEVELQTVGTKQNHERELEKLRVMIRAREDTIGILQRKIDKYDNEMTNLEEELDRYRLQHEGEQEEELKLLSKEIEESKMELKKESENRLSHEKEIERLNGVIQTQKDHIIDLEKHVESFKQEIRELKTKLLDAQSQIKDNESNEKSLKSETQELRKEMENWRDECMKQKTDLGTMLTNNIMTETLKTKVVELENEAKEKNMLLEKEKSNLSALKKKYDKLSQVVNTLEREASLVLKNGEDKETKISELENEIKEQSRMIHQLQDDLKDKEEEKEGLRKMIEQEEEDEEKSTALLQDKLKLKEDRIKELEKEIVDLKESSENRVETVQREKEQWKERLTQMQERHEESLGVLRTGQSTIEEQLRTKDTMISELKQEKDELNMKILIHQAKTDDSVNLLRDQQSSLEENLKSRDKQIESLRNELKNTRNRSEEADTEYNKHKSRLDQRIKELTTELDTALQNEKDIQDKLDEFKRVSREDTNRSFARLREEIATLTRVQEDLKDEHAKKITALKLKEVKDMQTMEMNLEEKERELLQVKTQLEKQKESTIDIENNYNDLKNLHEQTKKELRQDTESHIARVEEEKRELTSLFETERSEIKTLLNDYKSRCEELEDEVGRLQKKLNSSDIPNMKNKHDNIVKEKEETIERLKLATSALEDKVSYLQNELDSALDRLQLQDKNGLSPSKSTLSNTNDQVTIAELTRELDRLRKTLQRSKSSLYSPRQNDDSSIASNGSRASRTRGLKFNDDQNKTSEEDLRKKLHDRDTTISALVKSSVSQENKIVALTDELKGLKLNSPITDREVKSLPTKARKDEETLRKDLSDCKQANEKLTKDIAMLKRELNISEKEIKRLKSSKNSTSTTKQSKKASNETVETLEKENERLVMKITERDATISSLVKASMSQEKQVSNLREEMNSLRKEEAQQSQSTKSKDLAVPSWAEFNRLQQESEIFAGQIIEQDEELEELRNIIDKKDDERNKLEKELSILKSKLRRLDNTNNMNDLQEELEELRVSNKALREELRDLRRKLRHTQSQADRVSELENDLKDAESVISTLKKERSQGQMDEFKEAELKEKLERNTHDKTVLEGKLKRSQERESELQTKLTELTDQKENLEMKLKKNNEKLSQVKLSEGKLQNKLEDALASEKIMKDKMEKIKTELISVRENVELENSKIKSINSSINEAEARCEELESELKETQSKLKRVTEERDAIETKLQSQIKSLKEENGSFTTDINAEIEKRDRQVSTLENELKEQDEIMVALTNEVKKAREELKRKDGGNSNSDSTQNDTSMEELRKKVVEAEEGRVRFEKTMISTYERKLSLMEMNKDVTIDHLRKQLSQSFEKLKDMEAELNGKIQKLQKEKDDIVSKSDKTLKDRNAKIKSLQQTLDAHEQVSGHMKAELDQLQNGMETVSMTRRVEVEELQEELIKVQSKTTRYEREITALKMKLEERKLRYKDDVVKLKQTISQLESETPMMRDLHTQREEKKQGELASKYEQLKWRTAETQRENKALREKLENLQASIKNTSESKNDKWRNSALQEQIFVLQNKLKDMEQEQSSTTSSRKSRSSRKLPSTPKSNSSKDSIPRPPKT